MCCGSRRQLMIFIFLKSEALFSHILVSVLLGCRLTVLWGYPSIFFFLPWGIYDEQNAIMISTGATMRNGCAFICPVLSLPNPRPPPPTPPPPPAPHAHVLNCLKMDSQLSFTMNANSFTVPRKVVTGGEGRRAPSLNKMTLVHLFCLWSQTGEERHCWSIWFFF